MNNHKIAGFLISFLLIFSIETVYATEGTGKKSASFLLYKPSFSSIPYPGLGVKLDMQEGYNPQRAAGFKYLEIGGGVSVIYASNQNGLENDFMPFHFFAEFGKTTSLLSVGAGFNTGGRYVQEGVVLTPDYFPVYAKYNVAPLFYFIPEKLELYGLAGLSVWNAGLADERPNQPNTNRFQSDGGVGLVAGAGGRYYLGRWGLGAQLTYFSGKGEYALGGIERTEIKTGSTQLSLLVSYRFIFGGDRLTCPTYVR
jgi:hypothetical protein